MYAQSKSTRLLSPIPFYESEVREGLALLRTDPKLVYEARVFERELEEILWSSEDDREKQARLDRLSRVILQIGTRPYSMPYDIDLRAKPRLTMANVWRCLRLFTIGTTGLVSLCLIVQAVRVAFATPWLGLVSFVAALLVVWTAQNTLIDRT